MQRLQHKLRYNLIAGPLAGLACPQEGASLVDILITQIITLIFFQSS